MGAFVFQGDACNGTLSTSSTPMVTEQLCQLVFTETAGSCGRRAAAVEESWPRFLNKQVTRRSFLFSSNFSILFTKIIFIFIFFFFD